MAASSIVLGDFLPFDKNDEISQIFSESQAAAREIESLEQ
jgi:hypothetical protein